MLLDLLEDNGERHAYYATTYPRDSDTTTIHEADAAVAATSAGKNVNYYSEYYLPSYYACSQFKVNDVSEEHIASIFRV
jgi:hypothetical protein